MFFFIHALNVQTLKNVFYTLFLNDSAFIHKAP